MGKTYLAIASFRMAGLGFFCFLRICSLMLTLCFLGLALTFTIFADQNLKMNKTEKLLLEEIGISRDKNRNRLNELNLEVMY